MKIELHKGKITLEHSFPPRSFDEDESVFYLVFASKETKKLFDYYDVNVGDDAKLIEKIQNHFETYGSLKLYQTFLTNRQIFGIISEGVHMVDF
jgi:hypothetical protein